MTVQTTTFCSALRARYRPRLTAHYAESWSLGDEAQKQRLIAAFNAMSDDEFDHVLEVTGMG